MFYSNYNEGRLTNFENGLNKVIFSSFQNLRHLNEIGGAIYIDKASSFLFFCDNVFYNCSAKTSGGIHVTNSKTIECSRICANKCKNTNDYSYFSSLYSSISIYCTLYSTHFCEGDLSSSRFQSSSVTVRNINSTNNKGYQEAGFVLFTFTYASLKFADFVSNTVDRIGLNFFKGDNLDASHFHYDNCTISLASSDLPNHVQCHFTTNAIIINSYINVKKDDPNYAFSCVQATATLYNVYFPESNNINLNPSNQNYLTINTKTLLYTYFDTKLCPAIISLCLTPNINRKISIPFTLTLIALFYIPK